METIERLRRCCHLFRDNLAKPMLVEIDGQPWSVGTDGHMLLAVKGVVDGVVPPNQKTLDGVSKVLRGQLSVSPQGEVSIEKLVEFCGPAQRTTVETCTECDGEGSLCSCGECKCDECVDGEIITAPEPRRALVCGRLIDLNLLAVLLSDRAGMARVVIEGDADGSTPPLALAGDDWIALLMPLRKFGLEADAPRFEATP